MAQVKGFIAFKKQELFNLSDGKLAYLGCLFDNAYNNITGESISVNIFTKLYEEKDDGVCFKINLDEWVIETEILQEDIDHFYTIAEPYLIEADILYIGFNDSNNLNDYDFFRDTFKDGKWRTEEIEITFNKNQKDLDLGSHYDQKVVDAWKEEFESMDNDEIDLD